MKRSREYTGRERREVRRASALDRAMNPFYRLLRWIGAHVGGFYGAVGAFLVIGLGIIVGAALLFAGLAQLVASGATQRFDESVLLWLDQHANEELTVLALEITSLGSGAPVWMIVTVASVFLWVTRHRYSAALLWVAMLGAGIVNSALKMAFDRPRPELFEWRAPYAGLSSFPSGHSTTGMVVYATLAYLVVRLEPSRRLRRLTLGFTATIVVLIGITRLYLGVHYPSDVLGGFVVGLAWATVCALTIEAIRYFRSRKPEVARDEADLERGTRPIQDAVTPHGEGDDTGPLPAPGG